MPNSFKKIYKFIVYHSPCGNVHNVAVSTSQAKALTVAVLACHKYNMYK